MKASEIFTWLRKNLRYVLFSAMVVILVFVIFSPGRVFSGIAQANGTAPFNSASSSGSSSSDSSSTGSEEESWITRLEREAVAFYSAKYGDSDVTARVIDYGCHVQIDIIKNGKAVKSLSYLGYGQFYELN